MRIHNYIIIFVIIAIGVFLVIDIKSNSMEAVINHREQIDRNVKAALDDGIRSLVQVDGNNKLDIDKDAAVNSFFSSLYTSFGVNDDKEGRGKLNQYVPVVAITLEDGYYIFYSDEYLTRDGYRNISKRWSEKLPYYYEDTNFIYGFTLGELVNLYDKSNCLSGGVEQSVYSMDYHDIQKREEYLPFRQSNPNSILLDDESFELIRKEAIIHSIENAMAYYTSYHNHLARQFGITYNFSLPVMREGEWAPYLNDVGMYVVFQGYPYGDHVGEIYNRIASSGAKVSKNRLFYLEQIGWYYVYHRYNCPELEKGGFILFDEPLYDIESCVKRGAYACPACNEAGANAPDYKP